MTRDRKREGHSDIVTRRPRLRVALSNTARRRRRGTFGASKVVPQVAVIAGELASNQAFEEEAKARVASLTLEDRSGGEPHEQRVVTAWIRPWASAAFARSDGDHPLAGEYLLGSVVRDQSTVGRSFHSPLISAGWILAVLVPPVGLVIGIKALRKPFPHALRAQAAAIVVVGLVGSLMWILILTAAPGSHGFLTS